MTKHILALTMLCGMSLVAGSCLNSYLDRSPDSQLSADEVFSKYENFKSFVEGIYNSDDTALYGYYSTCFNFNTVRLSIDALTDICDQERRAGSANGKQGSGKSILTTIGYKHDNDEHKRNTGKAYFAWRIIRKCNLAIANIDKIQDGEQTDKEDLLAQAYFVRAFVNFEVFRFYGAVPYIDKPFEYGEDWDFPALGEEEFLNRVADDFQTAADHFKAAGKMRRDPDKSLNASDQSRPSGMTALAMKSRALLYAASPLNNPENDKSRWEAAAKASWEAILAAIENGYELLPFKDYYKNFYSVNHTNEQFWSIGYGNLKYSHSIYAVLAAGIFTDAQNQSSGRCPTQNFVDKFETIDGYALNTEAQRLIAEDAGSYNEQDPYVKRDPRFDNAVVYNQKKITTPRVEDGKSSPAPIYIEEDGSIPANSLIKKKEGTSDGVSETYYYEVKSIGGPYPTTTQYVRVSDPIIRFAELYLNYAEAVFEAYGSSDSKVDGATLTSVEALNVVRHRANMPDVRSEYCTDPEVYRSRIKNERTVELCFEGDHYYCDIRRWKDAPAIGRSTLYGMRATKLKDGYDKTLYPTGFRYERFALPSNRQIAWKNDGMYYIPFNPETLQKMKNYTPKQEW